jgi:hypothetical protein
MTSAAASILFLLAMLVAAAAGMLLRKALPAHHTTDASNDAVLRAVGLVVTLTALVLGFFVNSAKTYYDAVSNQLKQIGADVSVLDRTLERFGPDAASGRVLLRQGTGAAVRILWPGYATALPTLAASHPIDGLEQLDDAIRALPASDALHQHLKDQALTYTAGMEHESMLLGEIAVTRMQMPLLLIMLSWLVIIYLGFGLVWPRTGTAIAALVLSAVACSGAILMIVELDSPLQGLVRVPPSVLEAPLLGTAASPAAASQ